MLRFGPPEPLRSHLMMMGAGPSNGGSAWTPLALSPLIWLDATQLGLSNGASVAQFTDLSGNGNHFVQSTTASKPTFRSSGINGLASVESDGVDDAMTLAAYGAQTEWWGFVVCRLLVAPAYGVIWGVDDYNPDANYMLLEVNGSTQLRLTSSAIGNTNPNLTIATATNYAMLLTGNGTTGSLLTDSIGTGTRSGNFSRNNGAARLFNRGDNQPISCQLGELVHGSGTLTSDQIAALWAYANSKWGTAVP